MVRSLILDSESDCGELIERVLLQNGHEVVTFAQGQEALKWAHSNAVDLAIVSLNRDGTHAGTWKELKGLNTHLKVLLLARYRTKELAKKALEQGADDYLLKPFEIEEFEAKIKNLLQRRCQASVNGKPKGRGWR